MDRQCGPSTETQTTTPTESTKMFDANSTVKTSSTPTTPSSDGNKNFQGLIRFVKSIIFWAKSMLVFLNQCN